MLVAGLYILVQLLESNVITPQIPKKLVSILPALIIIVQLLRGHSPVAGVCCRPCH
jgi:predicted PurR-regulated permease PerM